MKSQIKTPKKLKNQILTIAIALASILTYAQGVPTGFLSFNTGLALPLGQYKSAYALPGTLSNAQFAMPIKTHGWGISATAIAASNNFNTNMYVSGLASSTSYSYKAASKGRFVTDALLFGAFYTIPKNKISIDFVAQIGAVYNIRPGISLAATDIYGNTAVGGTQSAGALSMGTNLGAGMRYSIGSKFAVCANLAWFTTSAYYKNVYVTTYTQDGFGNWYEQKQYTSFHQRTSLLNLTVGLVWQFAKNK